MKREDFVVGKKYTNRMGNILECVYAEQSGYGVSWV